MLNIIGQTINLGGVSDREIRTQSHRIHDKGQKSVQEAVDSEQRGDRGPSSTRRRLPQVQVHFRFLQVDPAEKRRHLDHQIIPGRKHS